MSLKGIGHQRVAPAKPIAITARNNHHGLTIISRIMTTAYSTSSATIQLPTQITDPLQGPDNAATQGIGEPVP